MRHKKIGRRFSRRDGHRLAMLRNLAASLFLHKRIKTTLAKAKELRRFAEPLITRAREGTVHAHRMVRRDIGNRKAMNVLFQDIAPQFADRPGGYTRVMKLGQRRGDGAPMAFLELVGFDHYFKREDKSKSGSKKAKKPSKQETEAASGTSE